MGAAAVLWHTHQCFRHAAHAIVSVPGLGSAQRAAATVSVSSLPRTLAANGSPFAGKRTVRRTSPCRL
eukprot:10715791-Prorocentrum_lima.AAC.1